MVRLDVTADLAGMHVTEAVAKVLPQLAGYNLKKLLRQGHFRLNGSLIKKDFETAGGDILEVYLPEALEADPVLDISYEDRNLLVLNKQPGVTIRGKGGAKDLLGLVRQYMIEEGEYAEELGCIPFAMDSLDKYTGGLVMFAKNGETFDYLRSAVRQRRVHRAFQAIIHGCPAYEKGEFQHFYMTDGRHERVQKEKGPGGVPIYTRYKILRASGMYTLLEINPVTAVPNQERFHLQAMGYPIVGDPVYGDPRLNKKTGIRHQALWSTEIRFATGSNNILEYLNGRCVRTDDFLFPLVNFADTDD